MFNEVIRSGIILGVNVASFGICIINGILPYIAAKRAGDSEKKIQACKIVVGSATCGLLATITSAFVW